MLSYVRQFFKIRVVFHALYLYNEVGDPQISFAFLTQLTRYLTTAKKNISSGKFSRERP